MKKTIAVILCVVGIVSVFAGCLVGFYLNKPVSLPEDFTATAHSGSEKTEDNSMEYLKKCVEINVQIAEFDVTFRSDGTPVLVHTEQAGDDEGLLFDEAVRYLSENTSEMRFNLDLKSVQNLPAVREITDKYGLTSRCFFTGVSIEWVENVKKECPEIPYYLNIKFKKSDDVSQIVNAVKTSGAIGLNCNYKSASKELVEALHNENMLCSLWTVNNELAMKKVLLMSPDNITTRKPVKLNSLIEK